MSSDLTTVCKTDLQVRDVHLLLQLQHLNSFRILLYDRKTENGQTIVGGSHLIFDVLEVLLKVYPCVFTDDITEFAVLLLS